MSEVQEKLWVVTRYSDANRQEQICKVFDDRADARDWAKRFQQKSRKWNYVVRGPVKKG